MGIYSGEDRLIDAFAARFEGEGRDVVFRANLKAAPVRVTQAERDEEIARYRRAMRWMMLACVVSALGAISALVTVNIAYDVEEQSWEIWAVVLALTAGLLAATWYNHRAPDRRFADRLPIAAGLRQDEVRRRKFGQISWSNLAMAPLGALVMLIPRNNEELWGNWWNIKLGAATLLMAAVAVQAYRKWRFEREDR